MIYVAFDIGNVLCHFDIVKFTKQLAGVTQISEEEAYFFLEHMQHSQDVGLTSVKLSLREKFKMPDSIITALIEAWNSTVTPSDMMMNFLENLRHEGVKIALLSNMGPEHISHLRDTVPQMFVNSTQHISCEVGARKPTKLFYQGFCHEHDEFSGCVYVDDIEENLRTGKRYGFQVYNFNLDEICKLPSSKQKIELDKLKKIIYNRV